MQTLDELLQCSFVIVDKPRGPSSHEVAAYARKILGVEKSGHSGTLDPNVSGVLPVGLGKATRLLPYVTTKDKKYVCLMKTCRELSEHEVLGLFKRFTGTITQTPPKMSAVAKKPRKRKVYYIKPLEIKPKKVLFEVHCEAGTYIRVIVSEFGRICGAGRMCKHSAAKQNGSPFCCGAEMLELRRISVGRIGESRAHCLQEITDAMWLAREKRDESAIRKILVPASEALSLRKMVLQDSAVEAVCAGSPLYAPGVSSFDEGILEGEYVALISLKGELVGIGRAALPSGKMADEKRGAFAYPQTIIMKRGTYARKW